VTTKVLILFYQQHLFTPREYLQICGRHDFASVLKTNENVSVPNQGLKREPLSDLLQNRKPI